MIQPKVMTVRARDDGHWYIGSGRSMAEGPYRRPEHLISVVADLMGTDTNWRIEVLTQEDTVIAQYEASELQSVTSRSARGDWPASLV